MRRYPKLIEKVLRRDMVVTLRIIWALGHFGEVGAAEYVAPPQQGYRQCLVPGVSGLQRRRPRTHGGQQYAMLRLALSCAHLAPHVGTIDTTVAEPSRTASSWQR